jgi:hypothetical protein
MTTESQKEINLYDLQANGYSLFRNTRGRWTPKACFMSDMLTPLRFKVNLLFSKLYRKNYFIISSSSRFIFKSITVSRLHHALLFIGQEIHTSFVQSQGLRQHNSIGSNLELED